MFKNFLNSRGFTLVEILASIVLLAVVISISLSIFPNMFKTNDINEESLDAVAIAKDALVKFKSNSTKVYIPKSEIQISSNTGDPGEAGDYYVWIEDSGATAKYPGYRVLIVIDKDEVKADPNSTTSAGLDLYQTTVEVYEGSSVRATNYGYVTGADFK